MGALTRTLSIIGVVVLLDRLTKLYIRAKFSAADSLTVIPRVFNIVHSENPGAAFGFLAESGPWHAIFLVGVSLTVMAVIGFLLWKPQTAGMETTPLSQAALALVFGGALGNLWDRLFRGTVTDFLQVFIGSYEFPSFNAADSAITIGACLLILDMLRAEMKRKKQALDK
jgi:signal peptidase II